MLTLPTYLDPLCPGCPNFFPQRAKTETSRWATGQQQTQRSQSQPVKEKTCMETWSVDELPRYVIITRYMLTFYLIIIIIMTLFVILTLKDNLIIMTLPRDFNFSSHNFSLLRIHPLSDSYDSWEYFFHFLSFHLFLSSLTGWMDFHTNTYFIIKILKIVLRSKFADWTESIMKRLSIILDPSYSKSILTHNILSFLNIFGFFHPTHLAGQNWTLWRIDFGQPCSIPCKHISTHFSNYTQEPWYAGFSALSL